MAPQMNEFFSDELRNPEGTYGPNNWKPFVRHHKLSYFFVRMKIWQNLIKLLRSSGNFALDSTMDSEMIEFFADKLHHPKGTYGLKI